MCGECSQCMDHTGFAPAHGVCALPVYTAQAPGCSARELSCPGLHEFPRTKRLSFRFSGTAQRHKLDWACVLCPTLVWAAQVTRCFVSALSQVGGASYHLPVLAPRFPGCAVWALSQVCCVSSGGWSQAATLLVDVNHPWSQEDLLSNWEPAHSLLEDAVSGAKIAPCLLALAVACLLLCLWPANLLLKKSADSLMGVPLHLTLCFLLLYFKLSL